jgi:predicted hydrocarbon binding protein
MKRIKLYFDRKRGEAYYLGENVLVLSRINSSCYQRGAERYMGRGAGIIVYNASKNIAKKRFYELVKGLKGKPDEVMRNILEHLSMCGYGLFEIRGFGEETLVEVRNSFNAIKYKSEMPKCYMMAGTLAGIMELITGKECLCMEEECAAKGDRVCTFRITPVPSGAKAEPVKEWWRGEKPPERATELFLDYDEVKGEVFFMGLTSSMVLSRYERVELQKELEKIMGPAYKTIMYESVGRDGTKETVNMIQKFFVRVLRMFSKRRIVESLLKNYSQRGGGMAELVYIDEKNSTGRIIVRNSNFARGYKKSDKPVCHILAGMFAAGGDVVFGRRMECRETKCVAKGDDHCEFELFPEKSAA